MGLSPLGMPQEMPNSGLFSSSTSEPLASHSYDFINHSGGQELEERLATSHSPTSFLRL